jgi:hypothetical protein
MQRILSVRLPDAKSVRFAGGLAIARKNVQGGLTARRL